MRKIQCSVKCCLSTLLGGARNGPSVRTFNRKEEKCLGTPHHHRAQEQSWEPHGRHGHTGNLRPSIPALGTAPGWL